LVGGRNGAVEVVAAAFPIPLTGINCTRHRPRCAEYKQTTVRGIYIQYTYIYILNTSAVVGIRNTNTHTSRRKKTWVHLYVWLSIQGNCRYSLGELKKYKNKEFLVHKNRKQKIKLHVGSWRWIFIFIPIQTNILCALQQTLHRLVFSPLSANFFTLREFIKYSCVFISTVEEKNDGCWFSGRRHIGIIYTEERERNAAAATTAVGSISKTRQPAPTFPLFSLCFFSRVSRRPTALLNAPAKQQPPKK